MLIYLYVQQTSISSAEVPVPAVVPAVALVVGAVPLGRRRVARGGPLALVLVAHDAGGLGLAMEGLDCGAGLVGPQLGVEDLV